MEVPGVKLALDTVVLQRPSWSLVASGVFAPGIHLVSGDVGSGKSTLALEMAGLQVPDLGTVTREGITSSMLSLQFPDFHVTGFSVAEECASWGLETGDVLHKAGFEVREEVPVLSLSRGELKRLHLACVLSRSMTFYCSMNPFRLLIVREKKRSAGQLNPGPGALLSCSPTNKTSFQKSIISGKFLEAFFAIAVRCPGLLPTGSIHRS